MCGGLASFFAVTMKIDAHQHFWKYVPSEYGWIDDSMKALRRDFLPEDLRPELNRNGFDGSIAVQARQSLEETRWLLDLADRSPFIAGVVGWVDLQSRDLRQDLESLAAKSKLVGVRHVVQSEPDDNYLLQPEFLRGLALLREYGLAYDILIYPKHLPVAARFVGLFPDQPFVLDHLGKPPVKKGTLGPWSDGIRQLASFPNVYCKLSGLVTEADWRGWKPEDLTPFLDVAFECFGSARLMIGSDWPVCTLAANYSETMGVVREYLSKYENEVQDAVLGGNAARFWNLEV
jgi:L-fuconolactonase